MSENIIVKPKDLTRIGVASIYDCHKKYNIIKRRYNKIEKQTRITIYELSEYYSIPIDKVIQVINGSLTIDKKEHYLINRV